MLHHRYYLPSVYFDQAITTTPSVLHLPGYSLDRHEFLSPIIDLNVDLLHPSTHQVVHFLILDIRSIPAPLVIRLLLYSKYPMLLVMRHYAKVLLYLDTSFEE